MNTDVLEFVTLTIGAVADRLGMQLREVFQRLKKSGILDNYIIPSYDVLHTFSLKYVVDDVVDFMREEGALK